MKPTRFKKKKPCRFHLKKDIPLKNTKIILFQETEVINLVIITNYFVKATRLSPCDFIFRQFSELLMYILLLLRRLNFTPIFLSKVN